MENLLNLTELEKDALKEVGNIGTGNAATALSKLLNRHVEIIIPETKFVPIKKFLKEFGDSPEKTVVSTYLEILGDLKGEVLFIFPIKSAEKIVDIMMCQEIGSSKIMDEEAQSAFKEMSNILTGAYLNSLANMMDFRLLPSVPNLATDYLGSVLDFTITKVSNYSNTILSIKTNIQIKDVEIEGFFVIVFDLASLNKLLKRLKDMYRTS